MLLLVPAEIVLFVFACATAALLFCRYVLAPVMMSIFNYIERID